MTSNSHPASKSSSFMYSTVDVLSYTNEPQPVSKIAPSNTSKDKNSLYMKRSILSQKNKKKQNKTQKVQFKMYDSINNSRTVTRPTSPREYEYESQRGIKSARIDVSGESRNLTENFMKNELLNFKKKIHGVVSEKPVPKGRNTGVHQAYYTQGATSSCSMNMTPRTRRLSPVV